MFPLQIPWPASSTRRDECKWAGKDTSVRAKRLRPQRFIQSNTDKDADWDLLECEYFESSQGVTVSRCNSRLSRVLFPLPPASYCTVCSFLPAVLNKEACSQVLSPVAVCPKLPQDQFCPTFQKHTTTPKIVPLCGRTHCLVPSTRT